MSTPIMETALDDIFYTIDTAGKVSFFRLSNGSSQVEASGSYEITVSCAYQDLKPTSAIIPMMRIIQSVSVFPCN